MGRAGLCALAALLCLSVSSAAADNGGWEQIHTRTFQIQYRTHDGHLRAAYVLVPDSHKAADATKKAGGQVLNGPMEVPGGDWIAIGMDPQGGVFAVHSRRTAVPAVPTPAGSAGAKKKTGRKAAKKAAPKKAAKKAAPKRAAKKAAKKAKPAKKAAKKKK